MPILLIDRLLNVAVPADAATVFVPLSVPPPGFVPIATVTDADEFATLPNWSCSCTVTAGLIDAPAVALVGCCPITSFAAAAGFTVSIWVSDVSPNDDAVMVGDPARVSLYLKLILEDAFGIVAEVIVVVSPVSRNTPPAEVDDKPTSVDPEVAGFPNVSRRCTVIVPDVTPAVSVCDDVVNTKLVADAPVMVSAWFPEVSPEADAVMVGAPAFVSP